MSPCRGLLSCLMLVAGLVSGASPRQAVAAGFDITVLGARGGLEDGNLSAYMIHPIGDPRAVLCDAGTVLHGLQVADQRGALDDTRMPADATETRPGFVLHHGIAAYLISHAHLDHVAGLVLVSPDDSAKSIYALPSVTTVLSRDLFNGAVWPNNGDIGTPPRLGLYHYQDLAAGQPVTLAHTGLRVTAFPLSHGSVESTAFLLQSGSDAMLYFGDTGADAVEHGTRLQAIWQAVAPLVRAHRLRGIVIECSYDDTRPDNQLWGHLSPRWLLRELTALQDTAHTPLRGMPVLVAHIKPSLRRDADPLSVIPAELREGNRDLGVNFIVPEQGMRLQWR
ncbi:3',5'-cyclic-nucleotide phosphodiesterase [Komagataeibacter intermedius]|uniref:3',5'-cyclic-nucleotide phosphodiesterase n=2 Tax=Komagataeibacter intermedius TaxID=66229 RepID=A0A0N1FBJ5_9PROT|nr:3',5'-cyclic-nucleotide phosphodiesterase [Komagataeibacter intermedius]KPH86885.1 3',5'-cyclic-nucleotide phosphodiesterase [Komagataeibacter intermedius AF2]MCF3635453.1 3',5'-cyclic-nucleotide phosphodiesterase [Komagataeibacter intermedius]GAN87541.1 cyclic-AMP phosphodiesterase [Komagataeibacter intermedius TF2]GBQ78529.1 cyclic-AMP phosphodiesterase [Komagataeibacter intermedius NRIC 0521]